jgi:hypothetical protein
MATTKVYYSPDYDDYLRLDMLPNGVSKLLWSDNIFCYRSQGGQWQRYTKWRIYANSESHLVAGYIEASGAFEVELSDAPLALLEV